ncbi:DUF305 domain-containing protein [Arthrobacter sp. H14]|uniref:DUF305 domain-containing protein n=1 Tax=Arthrobacter sp. H14 TaxID=1312959 RepID=UPI00047C6319|nr:DUF305 domain-containing protein [Arthrobacter sp. H14]
MLTRIRPWHAAIAAIVLMTLLLGAFALGRTTAPLTAPAGNSIDAGFARDMQRHHAQAVEMSMVIREQSTDPEIRTMGYDIALTQQHQVGQMFAWLRDWSLPQVTGAEPMSWMPGNASHTGVAMENGRMPGMASPDDMERLRNLTGEEADRLYLNLMIQHHQAGVEMAEAALAASTETVRSFAEKSIASQASEIKVMEQMLAEE